MRATYTILKYNYVVTLGFRRKMLLPKGKERKRDKTTMWFKLRQKHIDIDKPHAYYGMPQRMRVETEELLQEGCRRLIREKSNGIKINVKQTASDLKVPYTTLRNRSC